MTLAGADDPFRDVSTWSDVTAADWVALLDQRAAADDQAKLRAELLRLAHVEEDARVLEIGCGTGALLLDIARMVGPAGRVLGTDPVPSFIEAARERLSRDNLGAHADARVGSADRIDLPDASVDVCVAQTVLIHLAPEVSSGALDEVRRIIVPDGRFVTADQDADTWTIDHPDRDLTRRIVQFNSDQRYADGWTGRRLHRLLRDMGLDGITVNPVVHVDAAGGSYLFGMAIRCAQAAAAAGAIAPSDADAWQTTLRDLASSGRFFSSMNYYVAGGRSAS